MMNPYEKSNLVNALENALQQTRSIPTTTECKDCVYFEAKSFCKKWHDDIPAETLLEGCPEWEFRDDGIPF